MVPNESIEQMLLTGLPTVHENQVLCIDKQFDSSNIYNSQTDSFHVEINETEFGRFRI